MDDFERLLHRALANLHCVSRDDGGHRLALRPNSERGPVVTAVLDKAWIDLQTNAVQIDPIGSLDMLLRQSALPGGAKLQAIGRDCVLRAEVPLLKATTGARDWTERQLRLCVHAMQMAAANCLPALVREDDPDASQDAQYLSLACMAAGWNATVRADNSLAVELTIRGIARSLNVAAVGGAYRASLGLSTGASMAGAQVCRAAAATLLMRASAAMRWARAYATCDEDGLESMGFEATLAAPVDDEALLAAVDTLSAACEAFGREAEVLLESPALAAAYLERKPVHWHATEDEPLSAAQAVQTIRSFPAALPALPLL